MQRATLIIDDCHDAVDRERLDNWFDRWQHVLMSRSDNLGCGCCIDVYDVDAPEPALAELPVHWFASSDCAGPQPWLASPSPLSSPSSTDRETE